jgi:sugar fermentation stimulation protein A
VGRADIEVVSPADAIDPVYGQAIRRAVAAGVEALAYRCKVSEKELSLAERVPVDIG